MATGQLGRRYLRHTTRFIKKVSAIVTRFRPNPKPGSTVTITCIVQQLSARAVEQLMLDGITNVDAAQSVNFVTLSTDDVRPSDELTYNARTYKVIHVMPQDLNGVTLFKQAVATIVR